MKYVIEGREPKTLFRYFEELCAIPHPSYHEERIADYLEAFAKERNLECYRDEKHNVLIKKGASHGYEVHPPVLLQGHTDMVCEKNGDTVHDFLNDPLKLFVEGDLLGARGTTLGADDGVAVAVMLAVLDGEIKAHPSVECLFTVCEEVGLGGAVAFDASRISARRMLNLDSEDFGVVTAGCAGGLRSLITLSAARETAEGEGLCISLCGLFGGHSGCDIHRGRANANKLMGRILAALDAHRPIRILSIDGGSKDNAIPRECTARIVTSHREEAVQMIEALAAQIAMELHGEDSGFCVKCTPCECKEALSLADSKRVISLISSLSDGVLAMHTEIEGLVEYSRNLGVIRTEDEGVFVTVSSRSSMEERLDATVCELNELAASLGCRVSHGGRYPGWEYASTSPIRDIYLRVLRETADIEGRVEVIHAGLECGVIYSKIPDMDMISIGPTMYNIHSPDERLVLSSLELFWKTIEATLGVL